MRNVTTLIVFSISLSIACSVLAFGYRMLYHTEDLVSSSNNETAIVMQSLENTRYCDYNNKIVSANQVQSAITRWGISLTISVIDGNDEYTALTSIPNEFDNFAKYDSVLEFNNNGNVTGILFTKL